ncbi:sugar phosphate isomerase/epimerase [Halomicroarcula sp. S1AR25-4]|uniref:sugar phosphate isomerase/epimerase family protein n=1 Tax=Haloarcula sp. S1AR25-4 TaxID=2950538 RepID=UPI00287483E8|nr:sugar phosphate isomerase/epimerase family protein [Halomicroarcula sp. S1AR25-4]MDS0276850.1 sugar phosphate isomerase/epimerase [Halomicroarcula sp. S1AR25-4]
MQFGFSTNAFRDYSLPDAIDHIGAAGYDGVELLFDEPHLYPETTTEADLASVRAALADADVAVSNANAFMLTAIEGFHHPSFVEPDEAYRRRRVDYTHDALKLAAALDVDTASIEPGGPIPDGKSREWAEDRFVEGLRELAETAADVGVDVLVEPEPDLLVETSGQFLDLLDRVDSDRVGCNFDAGHLFCVGEDPSTALEELLPYVEHVHIEDIPADRSHEHTQLGDGAMDIDGFLEALEASGYDGFVTVELYPYGETPVATAEDAMAYLEAHGWA